MQASIIWTGENMPFLDAADDVICGPKGNYGGTDEKHNECEHIRGGQYVG